MNQGHWGTIFLQAYPETVTGYEIAKRVYKKDKFPPTSRIYTKLKDMRKEGYVRQNKKGRDKGFLSKAEPVAAHVGERLATTSAPLTQGEEKNTQQILDSKIFRSQIALTDEFHNCSENGLTTLLRELGRLACIALVVQSVYQSPRGAVPREFQAYIAKSAGMIDETYEKVLRPLIIEETQEEIENQIKSRIRDSMLETLSFVLDTDKTLLQKFAGLLTRDDYLSLKQQAKLFSIVAKEKT